MSDEMPARRPPWYELPPALCTAEQRKKHVLAARQRLFEEMGHEHSVLAEQDMREALARAENRSSVFASPQMESIAREEVYDPLLHGDKQYKPEWAPLTPLQLSEFWRRIFGRESRDWTYGYGYRIRTAWRVAREMARLQGIVPEGMLMAESLPPGSEVWFRGISHAGGLDDDKVHVRLHSNLIKNVCGGPGEFALPLGPPRVPEEWLDEGEPRPEYEATPQQDPRLHRWLWAVGQIVDALQINLPPPGDASFSPPIPPDPEAAREGLRGLLDPLLARLSYPAPMDIMGFEHQLVHQTIAKMAEHATAKVQRWLAAAYGLSYREQRSVIKMARAQALAYSYSDPEEARSIIVARLEKMFDDASKSLDMNNQVKIMKQIQLVLGLGKIQPEDRDSEMRRIVQEIASSRGREGLTIPTELLE